MSKKPQQQGEQSVADADVRFTPKSGHRNSGWNVRFVPEADIKTRSMLPISSRHFPSASQGLHPC